MLVPSLVVMAFIVSFLSLCWLAVCEPRFTSSGQRAPKPNNQSVIPDGRYPTEDAVGGRHMADRREREVSSHQRLAVRRQLPQKTDPNAGRLLGVVFETVMPVGVVKTDREHGVASERQPVAAGRQADHAVPGGVTAGATDDDSRRHLVLLPERSQLSVIFAQETTGRPPKHVLYRRRHGGA